MLQKCFKPLFSQKYIKFNLENIFQFAWMTKWVLSPASTTVHWPISPICYQLLLQMQFYAMNVMLLRSVWNSFYGNCINLCDVMSKESKD